MWPPSNKNLLLILLPPHIHIRKFHYALLCSDLQNEYVTFGFDISFLPLVYLESQPSSHVNGALGVKLEGLVWSPTVKKFQRGNNNNCIQILILTFYYRRLPVYLSLLPPLAVICILFLGSCPAQTTMLSTLRIWISLTPPPPFSSFPFRSTVMCNLPPQGSVP